MKTNLRVATLSYVIWAQLALADDHVNGSASNMTDDSIIANGTATEVFNSSSTNYTKCVDSPLKLILPWNGKVKGVKWVGKRAAAKPGRCHRGNVESQYPLTCNLCEEYACKDSRRRFVIRRNKRRVTW